MGNSTKRLMNRNVDTGADDKTETTHNRRSTSSTEYIELKEFNAAGANVNTEFTNDITKKHDVDVNKESIQHRSIFPRNEEMGQSDDICSLSYEAQQGELTCVKDLISAGGDVNTVCECHGMPPLMTVTEIDHVDYTKKLISLGADVNYQTKEKVTPLMIAASREHVSSVRELIMAGADVNLKNENQDTALMLAAKRGNVDILKMLVSAGADVNMVNVFGASSLLIAAHTEQVNCGRELIDAGADVNIKNKLQTTAIMFAALNGNVAFLKMLVSAGADVNTLSMDGSSPLMLAANNGHVNCGKELIVAKADVNIRNKNQTTALSCAVMKGNVAFTKMLISAGADVNMGLMFGASALIVAAHTNQLKCGRELIDAGADVNLKNKLQETAIMFAALNENVAFLKMLVSAGANVNTLNIDGTSPLMIAAINGHVNCGKELIDAGAIVNIRNKYQTTALGCAVQKGNVAFVKMIISAGAEVNTLTIVGLSPLMIAATMGHVACGKELIDAGADMNLKTGYQMTALKIAAFKGDLTFLKMLIDEGASVNMEKMGELSPSISVINEGPDSPDVLGNAFSMIATDLKQMEDMFSDSGIDWAGFMSAEQKRYVDLVKIMTSTVTDDVTAARSLISAASFIFPDSVKQLSDTESDVNIGKEHKNTTSIFANEEGNKDTAKWIYEWNRNGTSPLMLAVNGGHINCTKELIGAGADVNYRNKKQLTALFFAVMIENVDLVKMLISAGAEVNTENHSLHSPLWFAGSKGNVNITKILISAGANVDYADTTGLTTMMVAAEKGHTECLKQFIDGGADVNKQDKVDKTALMIAAVVGKVECLKGLIAAGADVNKQDKGGNTALMYAAVQGHVQCLKELMSGGADINKQNNSKSTVLMITAGSGHIECLRDLISAGADVNIQIEDGHTASTLALLNRHVDCVKELIAAGAGNNTNNNETLQQFTSGNVEFVTKLLEAGIDVNSTDENGNTALMSAVRNSNTQIVQLLIEKGAKVNTANDNGETALLLAVYQSHIEFERQQMKEGNEGSLLMVQMLLVAGAHLHETKSSLNPSTIHLEKHIKPNPQMLKMLHAAGGKCIDDRPTFSSIIPLQDHARDKIREILKRNHPDKNLYSTIPHLGLPYRLHSHLLHHTIYNNTILKDEENLLLKTTERDVKNVQYLIAMNVNLNVQDENGLTALMIASQNGFVELVEEFIKAGGDLNIQALFGNTALIYAARNQQYECLQKLIKHGASTNIQGKDGYTALMYAATGTCKDSLHALLGAGANPNIRNDTSRTALILGAHSLICVEELIKAGADVNCMDKNGDTALIVAANLGEVDCVKKLIESGANMNDTMYCTALMAAAGKGNWDCLNVLIQEGADLNIMNKFGNTALKMAVISGSDTCFKTLLQAGAAVKVTYSLMVQWNVWKDLREQTRKKAMEHVEAELAILYQDDKKLIAETTEVLIAISRYFENRYYTELFQTGIHPNIRDFLSQIVGEESANELTDATQNKSVIDIRTLIKTPSLMFDRGANADVACDEGSRRHVFESEKVSHPLDRTCKPSIPGQRQEDVLSKDSKQQQKRVKPFVKMIRKVSSSIQLRMSTLEQNINNNVKANLEGLSFSSISDMQKEQGEIQQNMFKMFFEAGGIPDSADNYFDFKILKAALERFGWKSPLKLATLCKQKSNQEMLNVLPIHCGCPMMTNRKGRRYLATVSNGYAISLQGDKSDVKLDIKKGCPKRAVLMEVRSDPSNFQTFIRDDECFISPIVEVLAPAETTTSAFLLRIPHCLDKDDDRTKVKVRMIHQNRNPVVVEEVPKGNVGALFYDINDRFIELHSKHFCHIICTICQTPYHCRGRINSLWFANFDTDEQSANVEIRPYFGGVLHSTVDFRKSVEETVNLRFVTQGSLKKSGTSFNPASGQIKFSLNVADPAWIPRQGLDKWNKNTRTFKEEKQLWEVMGDENTHRCREPPFEAAVYNLKAEGEGFDKFRGNSKTELTVVVEETSDQEQEKKQEHCSLELPVDFSMEDVTRPLPADNAKRNVDYQKKQRHPRISKEELETKLKEVGLDELPSEIHDREIARLAPLFSPFTLETVALQHFCVSKAQIESLRVENVHNVEGFKRSLLTQFRNRTGHTRKDLYRMLLTAESEGFLDDTNMTKVEKLILDPKSEMKAVGLQRGGEDEVALEQAIGDFDLD